MGSTKMIKQYLKYKNRKLYDQDISTYVNLSDIRSYMLDNPSHKIQIINVDTGTDVTQEMLTKMYKKVEESLQQPAI